MGVGYNPRTVTDGLLLYLDAANKKSYSGSGTSWTDLSGNGNNGTLTNGPTFDTQAGGNFIFDGANDFVNAGSGIALSGSWTICAFFKISATSGLQTILGRTGSGDTSYAQNYLLYTSSNKLIIQTSADSYNFQQSITVLTPNQWYYGVGVYDSSTKVMSLYLNGKFDNNAIPLTGNPPTAGNQYVTIGANDGLSAANRLTGNVALASIYNRALSANEILQNFNAIRGRFGI